MNKNFFIALAIAAAAFQGTALAEIPIVGTEESISLADIVGTPTLITVILKDSGARDKNLRLAEVREDRIIVLTEKGDVIPYLNDTVEAVEVQGGAVEVRRLPQMDSQVLRAEHQRVVDRAWARIREIYDGSADDQKLRIRAATLLTVANDADAHNYLRQLAESNDIMTQLEAAGALFVGGDSVSETLLRQGLDSGNRNARAMAAGIAGLTGYKESEPYLRALFQDRAVQLSAPAARAMARLGIRDIVPRLITMIHELHEEKGEAAIFALTLLADDDVIEQIKFRLLEADGNVRFRLVRVLHGLHDPMGKEELKYIFKNYPTLTPEVALLLAKEGDWDATQYLRNRLTRREDPTEPNLRFRARNAKALLEGGDASAMAVFQELLRSDNTEIIRFVFGLMTELGNPRLITLLQPSIENVDKSFSLGACEAVIALALPQFKDRLLTYRGEFNE